MLDKPDMGTITIEAVANNGALKLIIADDGGGIDPDVIKDIVLKKGIIDENEIQSVSEDELVQLIFLPGFSTKTDVSDISGRGVGMDAVKAAADKLDGAIEIKTVLGQGTTFEITIPNAT